jgi:hypothetical protein
VIPSLVLLLLLSYGQPGPTGDARTATGGHVVSVTPVNVVDHARAHAVLASVLQDRRFATARAIDWRAMMWRRAKAWLQRLWNASGGKRIGERTLGDVLAWILAFGAALGLAAWLFNVSRRRREGPAALAPSAVPRPGGRELALEADALVRAGRFRDAIRVAYRAAVQRLEDEGTWRGDAARTPREYLRLLPPAHRRRASLVRLTHLFERAWYGRGPASAADGAEILCCLADLECLPRDHAI